jgi:hypothetical protein
MFGKSRALAVAMAAAGVIGIGAPVANAATMSGHGDNGGLINISHNQVPVQACNNDVGVGVAGGGVPVDGVAVVGALLGVAGNATSHTSRNCGLVNGQDNRSVRTWGAGGSYDHCSSGCTSASWGMGGKSVTAASDNGGLINVSHNQVPIQVCNNDVAVGVLGGAVTADSIAGALGILGTTGNATSSTSRSCSLANGQQG